MLQNKEMRLQQLNSVATIDLNFNPTVNYAASTNSKKNGCINFQGGYSNNRYNGCGRGRGLRRHP